MPKVLPTSFVRRAVGVCENLHGFASFDRVRRDELRHAACELRAQALRRTADDRNDLRLGERLEKHFGTARTDRGIDFARIARRRADHHEIGGRAVVKKFFDIRGDARVRRIVVGRFEREAFVLEHFEQLRLQRRVHLAELVDEEHAAVRFRHESEFRFGDRALGELAARALIDRIVHAAQQRIGRFARIPAQRRAAGFHERRVLCERREAARLRDFEREPRDRRFPDTGRPIEDHVLWKRRRDLRKDRRDGRFLPDDIGERARAQDLHGRCREFARVERDEFFEFALRGGRLRPAVFANRFELEILQIRLMTLGHLEAHLRFDAIFDAALRDEIGEPVFDCGDRLTILAGLRQTIERRIFEH
jgi:hypothetical protein